MDSEQFDALVSRLTPHLTRRRSLGMLGALGVVAGQDDPEAKGKKKKKKKKKKPATTPAPATTLIPCLGCSACEECVDGFCRAIADGGICGTGGLCYQSACFKGCNLVSQNCPAGTYCTQVSGTSKGVCAPLGTSCSGPQCSGATCGQGQVCGITTCEAGTGGYCQTPITGVTTTTTPAPVCAGGANTACGGGACTCVTRTSNPSQVRCVSNFGFTVQSCTQDSNCTGGRICATYMGQTGCALPCD